MASIQLSGLTKFYGKRRGVENVFLDLQDKEFLTVFGPAGAGKTTTLNLIAGIVTPDQGSIRIGNRVVDSLEPADRNVAMVFESYALYPQLTVYQNMAFPLKSPKHRLPPDKVERKVRHFAGMLKIDHLLDRPIQALSNGQRQRTALGRALVRQPDVFLMDEPLSHLDAKLRHSMRAELKEIRDQLGTTTIYVTHDYLEAMSLGDRVAVINHGQILQVGTPEEVYFRPASVGVAQLFGDPEINIAEAKVQSKSHETVRLQMLGEDWSVSLPADVAPMVERLSTGTLRVGFRPPDIEISTEGKTAFHGVVYSFEPLGTKSVLTIDSVCGQRVRVLVDGHRTFQVNHRINFSIPARALIFFDTQNAQFLARSSELEEGFSHG
ncbi:MAG TPA: ABC transporter ATP-binding protein [Chthoniobacterales bacterium]|nr:ABC transporter ATP-binding protein [Chthoniobacterales bacterium]